MVVKIGHDSALIFKSGTSTFCRKERRTGRTGIEH